SFASTPFSLRNGTIQVYQSGFSLAVSTDFGLLVMYDANHYVRISVPFNYFNATCGLCGTFNSHREDDFRSRTGQILTSDVDFASVVCTVCANQSCNYGLFSTELHHKNNICFHHFSFHCIPSEISCPANSHFESQGTSCPATCSNLNASHGCPLPSQESCICNLGYVLSAGVCVPLAQCGCTFENRYYSSGATVILDQNCGRRCICSRGSMACYSHGCGELEACSVEDGERGCRPTSYATCWVEGPRSYRTFDGVTFQYPGACGLILARVMGWSPHTHFVVSAEKDLEMLLTKPVIRCPGGVFGIIVMLKDPVFTQNLTIHGPIHSFLYMDQSSWSLCRKTAPKHDVSTPMLHSRYGVLWMQLSILCPPNTTSTYNSSLSGLCGNYNGHRHDDFRTPNGVLVNNSQLFGDSWRDGSLSAHCVETENRVLVGPRDRVEECVEDLTEAGGAPGVLCEALRGYALMCQQIGITVGNWRDVTDCGEHQ
uniref:VWFD domain-containing protein n=1 Tax=Oncorhynchus kisutch TaxID=8019 RepID=A0A8C7I2P0_ONCKI